MDNSKTKPVAANPSLFCFEYKLTHSFDNNVNFVKDMNYLMSKRNNQLPLMALVKSNVNASNDEDYIHFEEKRNYAEDELFAEQNIKKILAHKSLSRSQRKAPSLDIDFSIHNNLDFPLEHIFNPLNVAKDNQESSAIDFQHNIFPKTNEIQHTTNSEAAPDEESRLVMSFAQLNDNKAKVQFVKKFVSFYKKYRLDEGKSAVYFNKLAAGLQKPPNEIKAWILYEFLKNRLESILTSISKELTKLILTIQMHDLTLDQGNWSNSDAKFVKGVITGKIRDYLELALEGEQSMANSPFISQYLDIYASTKGKKKPHRGFYRDRLIKRIKEMFEKSHLKISEERVVVIFFPQNSSLKGDLAERSDMNSWNDKSSNISDNSNKEGAENQPTIKKKVHKNLSSANSCLERLVPASQLKLFNKSPKMSVKYKVKQYVPDDFL